MSEINYIKYYTSVKLSYYYYDSSYIEHKHPVLSELMSHKIKNIIQINHNRMSQMFYINIDMITDIEINNIGLNKNSYNQLDVLFIDETKMSIPFIEDDICRQFKLEYMMGKAII